MLNEDNLPQDMRIGVWAKAANMAVVWENPIMLVNGHLPSYTQFYGKEPKYIAPYILLEKWEFLLTPDSNLSRPNSKIKFNFV